jgi:hypothetical protein
MVFVVFPRAASNTSRTVGKPESTQVGTLTGSWQVNFQPNLGAPPQITLAGLQPWSANTNDGVKYFSGTATYTKILNAPQGWFQPRERMLLDLGRVGDMAEVSVNGKPVGLLWKPPYRIDVTDALKAGENRVEIQVTNEWNNRMLGDQKSPAAQRVLNSTDFGRSGVPQLPKSGLLGPVTIVREVIR